MRCLAVACLLACVVGAALGHDSGYEASGGAGAFGTFIADNPIYDFMPDTLTELTNPDAKITLFVPLLTNVTAPQAAEFPELLLNLVLPKVYHSAADLLAAAPLRNAANITITLRDDPGNGVIHAFFREFGATADIFPVAFRVGQSVAYLITPLTPGDLPEQLGV